MGLPVPAGRTPIGPSSGPRKGSQAVRQRVEWVLPGVTIRLGEVASMRYVGTVSSETSPRRPRSALSGAAEVRESTVRGCRLAGGQRITPLARVA